MQENTHTKHSGCLKGSFVVQWSIDYSELSACYVCVFFGRDGRARLFADRGSDVDWWFWDSFGRLGFSIQLERNFKYK